MTPATATFVAVCMGLIVLEIGVMMGAVVFLALRVMKVVDKVHGVAESIHEHVAAVRSGWGRAFQGAGALLSGFWGSRRKHPRPAEAAAADRY